MTYLRYWSLRRKPFLFGHGEDFFSGVPQREALAGLSYFVGCEENLAMLVSPNGNGLTWLLDHVKQMRGFGDLATELVITAGDHLDQRQALVDICRAMGFQRIMPDVSEQFDCALATLGQQDVRLVWMLDRCHPDIAKVAQEVASRHENLSVLFGCSQRMAGPTVVCLGRCPMQIDLSPLSLEDTCDYVGYCMERAGGNRQLFSDNTTVRLHEVTGGIICNLAIAAESSLALAASHQLDAVTPAIVEAYAERQRRAA